MNNDIKSKLDAAFLKHEASKRAAVEAKQAAETKEQVFLRQFVEARESIIRPAMEEVGEYIKGKGYTYEIFTEDDKSSPDGRGRSTPASIQLALFLDERRYPVHDFPNFSIICEKGQQRVRFHGSTISPGRGGYSGSAGEATLSEVTKELVQEKILKIVTEVFR